jgi:metal-responsive CopG/Arc/MetJ family transcriptional regulator
MKTAISVEARLLRAADNVAKELGWSRSHLFSVAVEGFLRERRVVEIRQQLDRVYTDMPPGPKMKAAFRRTIEDRW